MLNKNMAYTQSNEIRMERIWAMPNKWTFTIKPIHELIQDEITPLALQGA